MGAESFPHYHHPVLSPSHAVLRDMIAAMWLFWLSLHLSSPFTIMRGCSAGRSVTEKHIFHAPFFLHLVILGNSCPGLSMWVCKNGMGLDQVSGKKSHRKHH